MVEFFVGDTLDCSAVFAKIKERRGNGKRQILIVPDRFMLYYEKAVMDYLDLTACFDVEVVSFSRLANKSMGSKMNDYLSAQGAVMLLRKVIEKNKDKLSCFRGAYNNADFASEIYAVISQIRNSGVSSDRIEEILPSLPVKILNKSKDIVLLYKGYVEELQSGYTDGSSKLEALTEAVESRGMQDSDVYISDYLYLSNVQRRICEKIFAAANYCGVFMVGNDDADNARIYPSRCLQILVGRAEACGALARVHRLPSVLKGDKKAISRELFAYGGKTFESDAAQAAARLILGAIRTVAKGFRLKDVTEFAKNAVLGLDFDKVCAFENFCIKYGLDTLRFSGPFKVGENDADYDAAEEIREVVFSLLGCFASRNATAEEYYGELADFLVKADYDARYESYVASLKDRGDEVAYNCALQASDKIKEIFARSVKLLGDCRFSLSSYLNIISSAVATTEISLVPLYVDCVFVGEARESRYDGVRIMYVVGASAGTLPPEHGDNGIFAGKESREWAKQGVVVEPDVKEQNNAERLNTLMFLLKPSEALEISYSRYSAAGEPQSESVVVKQLCELLSLKKQRPPRTSPTWTTKEYAEYFAGKGNLADELIQYKLSTEMGICHDDKKAYDALYALACEKYGRGYVEALLRDVAAEEKIDPSRAAVWKGGHTSSSQIEKYMKCPFMHYMDYILRVHPRDKAEMRVRDMGSIIHEVLQRFFSSFDYKNATPSAIEKTVLAIAKKVLEKEEYRQMSAIPYLRGEIAEIKQRCVFLIQTLCRRMKNSDFEPYILEEAFGMDGKYAPIKIDIGNKKVDLLGRIDRVDRFGDYISIIDYKSAASITFSLPQVIYGERIQLFIYMKALSSQLKLKPAGVFYLPINNKFLSESKGGGRFKYVGFINTDKEIITHFDHIFASPVNGIESETYPIRRSDKKGKEGEVEATETGVAASPEIFDKLCDYVGKLVSKAAGEIDGGYIKASPAGDACKYCEYGCVCMFKAGGGVARKNKDSKNFADYPYFGEAGNGDEVE